MKRHPTFFFDIDRVCYSHTLSNYSLNDISISVSPYPPPPPPRPAHPPSQSRFDNRSKKTHSSLNGTG
jgi:hypothetical protein